MAAYRAFDSKTGLSGLSNEPVISSHVEFREVRQKSGRRSDWLNVRFVGVNRQLCALSTKFSFVLPARPFVINIEALQADDTIEAFVGQRMLGVSRLVK